MPVRSRTLAMIRLLRRLGGRTPRRKRLPRQLPPRPVELEYYKAIRALVVEPIRAALADIRGPMLRRMEARAPEPRADAGWSEGREPLNTKTDADDDRLALVRRVAARLADQFRPTAVEAAAKKFAERADDWNKKELGKQVAAAMGVKLTDIERPTVDRIPAFVRENVALIKTIPERAVDRVQDLAQEAFSTGMRPETMADRLQEIGDISENDAMRIARDQIGKLNAQVNEDRQRALGGESYIWRTVGDNRVRDEHEALEGQEFSWDAPPPEGNPGEPIQCFPGETRVRLFDARVEKMYRRHISSSLVVLTTSTGEELRATPNHPVLTGRGWLAAHLVQIDDDVFEACLQRQDLLVADPQCGDPSFEELFGALASLGVLHRVGSLAGGFHGDAVVNEQVDVVDVDGLLGFELDPTLSKKFCQDLLARADETGLRLGLPYLALLGQLDATDSIVRGADKLLALLSTELRLPNEHGSRTVAHIKTLSNELSADGRAADAKLLSQILDAGSADVEIGHHIARIIFGIVCRAVDSFPCLDTTSAQELGEAISINGQLQSCFGDRQSTLQQARRVVEKSSVEFSGHVYNLQTSSGWYVAQNLIVRNCRCYAEPVFNFAGEAAAAEAED